MNTRLNSIGSVFLLLLASLSLIPLAALAQDALTETYVSNDGAFSFQHPDGWFVQEDEDGLILLSDTRTAFTDAGPGEDSALLALITPAYLAGMDVTGDTPAEVLVHFASAAGVEIGDRKGLRLGERVAVRSDVVESDVNGMILAVRFAEGVTGIVMLATQGELVDFEALTLEIAATFGGAGETAGETAPCTVSADKEKTVSVRVGPGTNRTPIAFLPANQQFAVLGKAEANDGTLWWKLDKQEVAPKKAAAEAWVAQEEVAAAGDCDVVQDAAAPPIIQIVPSTTSSGAPSGPTAPLNTGGGRGIYIEFPAWQSQLPGGIKANSVASAKLVVYVTPTLTNVERAEYIKSTGELTLVERNRVDYIVRVVDAATGAEVGNQVFLGSDPPPFPPVISISGTLNGNPPGFGDVLPWLQSLLG